VIQESKEIQRLMKLLLMLPIFQIPCVIVLLAGIFVDIDLWIRHATMLMFTMAPIFSPFLILTKIKRYRLRMKQFLRFGCCCGKTEQVVPVQQHVAV